MLHQEHINQVHIIDRMEGEGLAELKIGDWVKGYHSGYFQVVGFGNLYGFRDDEWYKKGEISRRYPQTRIRASSDSCAVNE